MELLRSNSFNSFQEPLMVPHASYNNEINVCHTWSMLSNKSKVNLYSLPSTLQLQKLHYFKSRCRSPDVIEQHQTIMQYTLCALYLAVMLELCSFISIWCSLQPLNGMLSVTCDLFWLHRTLGTKLNMNIIPIIKRQCCVYLSVVFTVLTWGKYAYVFELIPLTVLFIWYFSMTLFSISSLINDSSTEVSKEVSSIEWDVSSIWTNSEISLNDSSCPSDESKEGFKEDAMEVVWNLNSKGQMKVEMNSEKSNDSFSYKKKN